MTDSRYNATLSQLIQHTTHVFLDFDGPICKIYAGLPAASVADRLRPIFAAEGISLPPPLRNVSDPLELLRFATTISGELADPIEYELRRAELQAVPSAQPTPHAHEVLLACQQTGRRVAVVSNNSRDAVEAYLTAQGLAHHVEVIVGRTRPDTSRLKPDPHLLLRAMSAMKPQPTSCVLIGDSISDVEAAKAAGIRSIGYANKPSKFDSLSKAGADAVVQNLIEIEAAILNSQSADERSLS